MLKKVRGGDTVVKHGARKRRSLVLATRIIVVAGVAWITLGVLSPLGGLADRTLMVASGLSLVTIILGAVFNRPKPYSAWFCFLGMAALFAAGSTARSSLGTLGHLAGDRPLLPDALTFAGYFLAGVGLVILSRKNGRRLDVEGFIDASVAAIAVMLVTWVYLIEPTLIGQDVALSVRLLVALYAPTSIFLFSITLNYATGARFRVAGASSRYLVAALGFLFIGDVIYMLIDTGFYTMMPRIADAPYALAFLLFPLGALHPSVNEVTPSTPAEADPEPSLWRLGLVSVGLIFPVVIILTQTNLSTEDQVVVALLLLALTGLAVVKLFRAILAQKKARARLKHQATHDGLTGLPNRTYAMAFIDAALEKATKESMPLSVMFLDLDRFKYVNDTLGHAMGDVLIKAVGERLRSHIREENMVARIGGDEFVIALPGLRIDAARRIAEGIQRAMSNPFRLGKVEVATGATIGLASFTGNGTETGASLIEAADTALYRGKETGRGQVTVFDGRMRQKVETHARIEVALRGALERNELSLMFQPIVVTSNHKAVGMEALIRWNHPELGLVAPADFIPVAEETGLIVEIGRWVLKEATKEAAKWRQEVNPKLRVSVNVSARQLSEPNFVEDVWEALDEANLPGEALDLEITESLLVAALEQIAGSLGRLKDLGVTLSVDDFGTGYSSLAYLKRFPVSRIKIDKSFINGVTDAAGSDPTLIGAIVAMGGGLGMEVVAEGVETLEQVEELAKLKVAYLQGYYFARPSCSAEALNKLIELT